MPKNIFRPISVVLACAALLLPALACTPVAEKEQDNMYYASDIAANPQQYTMFVNKEIEPVTNHLVTQMGLADKVAAGEYPAADALTSVQNAIKAIAASIDQVDKALPPANYADLRTNVLQAMVNAKDTLEAFEGELLQPTLSKENIERLRNVMEGDFIVLTGLFNVYSDR